MNITDGTGLFFMILSGGLFAARILGAKAFAKRDVAVRAAIGVILSLGGYVLFAAVKESWAYYSAAALIGLGNGNMYPAFLNMFINIARKDQRGTANSTILTAWDVGMGLGMVGGGFLLQYFNYSAAFWGAAVMQLVGTVLFYVATRHFYHKKLQNSIQPLSPDLTLKG